MKKIVLSLLLITASGAYVWIQSGKLSADELLGPALLPGDSQKSAVDCQSSPDNAEATAAEPPVPLDANAPFGLRLAADTVREQDQAPLQVPVLTESSPVPPIQHSANSSTRPTIPTRQPFEQAPSPKSRPVYKSTKVKVTPAAMAITANTGYADGIYTGSAVDAYYGFVQIRAIVQGGRLVGIKVLQYPSDRRTSVYINHQALPMLRDEVISAQSAHVDMISGATLTSAAFIRSLDSALRKASR